MTSQSGPRRKFDATLPLSAARQAYPDSEDPQLTAYVQGLLEEYHSKRSTPVPPCPGCGSHDSRYHCRPNQFVPLPLFRCRACKRTYSRLTGSPLTRLRHVDKMPAFIRLLSQQISLEEASSRLSLDFECVSNWLARFRQLILLHDPSGQWESRVRLGIKFQFSGTCPRCEYTGPFRHGGTALTGERRVICPSCRGVLPLDQLGSSGETPNVVVVHDPMNYALRRRGRGRQEHAIPVPVQATVAKLPARKAPAIEPAEPPALPDTRPERFDVHLPVRRRSAYARAVEEAPELTAFLEVAIAQALSRDKAPPVCRRCASSNTRLASKPRSASDMPTFKCYGCGRHFNRLVGTPLARITRKDALPGFVRLLSQQRPLADAVRELKLDERVARQWVDKFRIWLLQLDPSGRYEAMVRLGLKPAEPTLFCPRCQATRKVAFHGYVQGSNHLPYEKRVRQFRCKTCQTFVREEPETESAGRS
ncbi:DUF746 domain-containing protein [Ralstonia sp. SM1864_UCD524_TZ4]|uniref:DUF746 domain-containing protein n=2 Tax=Ralstonia solanacearum species complex TaxID=3116862 RepID=A0A0S4VD26_RALSL|nr:DUF746 domain-containing protein [Ralstonia pseudosolanacearum]CUV24080.1 conserved protein of unknown function [Ralstonia solanacearum]CUV32386.1 conserved protein of unknown function [Ralstonia solanacearum]CUV38866.1 conserved protein of unknown function [Ralstonia solanacearum]CUV63771.1 conserved protein of unknown function [Ralstonia solanacearum]